MRTKKNKTRFLSMDSDLRIISNTASVELHSKHHRRSACFALRPHDVVRQTSPWDPLQATGSAAAEQGKVSPLNCGLSCQDIFRVLCGLSTKRSSGWALRLSQERDCERVQSGARWPREPSSSRCCKNTGGKRQSQQTATRHCPAGTASALDPLENVI